METQKDINVTKASRDLTVVELFRSLYAFRKMILAFVFVTTTIVIVVSLQMRPVYRSDILLAPQTSDGSLGSMSGQFGGLAALAGLDIGNGAKNSNESIAVLKSRAFTEDFIKRGSLLPILFEEKWDSEKMIWAGNAGADPPTIEDAYILFNKRIRKIDQNPKTGLIRVSIDWYDRELAAEWANQMIGLLNDHIRENDIAVAEKSIDFLNQELGKHSAIEMQKGIYSLIEAQIEKIMLAKVQNDYAFRILDPAVVSDLDKRVRPRRTVMVIIAFVLAWVFAIFIALVRMSWRNWVID